MKSEIQFNLTAFSSSAHLSTEKIITVDKYTIICIYIYIYIYISDAYVYKYIYIYMYIYYDNIHGDQHS